MDEHPLVTIVTPSYNQGEFIEETLQSVARQDYDHLEHVVVDGGSDDETVDVLKQYENRYDLRWVSEPDEGQSDAVNKGFEKARGDVVGWLNADDVYYTRQVITSVVDAFRERPDIDVVYGDDVLMDRHSTVTRLRTLYEFDYERMRTCGWWGWTPASEATFYRRTVIEEEKLDTSLDYVMDFEYFLRLGERFGFEHVDEIFAGKRRHEAAKSVDRAAVEDESKAVMEQYGARLDGRGKLSLYLALLYVQFRWLWGATGYPDVTSPDLAFDGSYPDRRTFVAAQFPSVTKASRFIPRF